MTKSEKNHDTGLRILEVLKILLNEDATREEIMKKLHKEAQVEGIYTQEAFLKYFNTLKLLGFEFQKERYKYKLKNALYSQELTQAEKNVLYKLINSVSELHNKKEEKIFQNIVYKLDKYIDLDLQSCLDKALEKKYKFPNENARNNITKTLEDILNDEQSVNITYRKNNGEVESILTEIKEITNNHVVCYNSALGRNKKILLDSIVSVKQTPQKVSGKNVVNSVVFELYGRLKYIYKPKKSEKVIEFSPDYIVVSNTEEDKDMLLLRLLKYGDNCKIIKPLSLQKEMLELTGKMLENIGA